MAFSPKAQAILEGMAQARIERETNAKRKIALQAIFESRFTNTCGWWGRFEEVASARPKSRKTKVSNQGEIDFYFLRINGNGKRVYTPVQRKTNGGRIEHFTEPYVVYSINMHNKLGDCDLPPVLFSTCRFLSFVLENHLYKSTNGSNPENAIQVSSRVLWRFVREQIDTFGEFTNGRAYDNSELLDM